MHDTVIVGGGLAGLACALQLQQDGQDVCLLESSDEVGGRIRTDDFEGFRLDRGFQVLLSSYPEAQRLLDYSQLRLGAFTPGALVRRDGRFHRLVDPWRRPQEILETLSSEIGGLRDRLRLAALRHRVSGAAADVAGERATTEDRLREAGFSPEFVEAFLRPWFGGVFLDRALQAPAAMFDFIFRMMASGYACLPEAGMEAIPRLLRSRLAAGVVRTDAPVRAVAPGRVVLDGGEVIHALDIVVATDAEAAASLLPRLPKRRWRSAHCLYFAAPEAPIGEPILLLDGEGEGPVNNLCFPSLVAAGYAPEGHVLVSATVLGDQHAASLREDVLAQLEGWFGGQVHSWRHLKTYDIGRALPAAVAPQPLFRASMKLMEGLYVCGDHVAGASIHHALVSGRSAAEQVVAGRVRRRAIA